MTEGSAYQWAWQVGDLWVDPGSARVVREGADIELPELSFRLLLALIEAAPERLSKDQLIAAVWRGGVVSDETLTQRVRLLRQALGDSPSAPRYLRAVRNYGYRLIAPVEPVAAGQPHLSKVGSAAAGRGLRWLLAVAAVLALAIVLWRWSGLLGSAADTPQGLAVLPLDNLSADAGRAYLVDGLHDELINRLSQIGGLSVVSRTSVLPYRDHQLPLTEIARQ
ncbi:MAG: winged helix-turn-helix domain-containing protein, partial [Xanthomonadales bacterium]|nr:winged helix-turn-helix domain-containing protein [Xanthomonadales bacterium]